MALEVRLQELLDQGGVAYPHRSPARQELRAMLGFSHARLATEKETQPAFSGLRPGGDASFWQSLRHARTSGGW